MPKALHDRVNKIQKGNKNMPESEAYGIATKQLQKEGKMQKGKDENDPKSVMPGKKEKRYKR